jgi:hypothetical protein
MSIPHMADLVIDMEDNAIAACESDNLTLRDFQPGMILLMHYAIQSSGKEFPA